MNLLKSKKYLSFLKEVKKSKDVLAVIVFGSYALETQNENSDLDICIITNKAICELDLDYPLKDEGFDVLFFKNLPESLKYRILIEGNLVYVSDLNKFKDLKRAVLKEYFGFEFRRNYYQKRLLESV